uniref:Dolichyl-phosphate-mannose-protein mannosyltransferase n=1 Tax=uncultured bacterium pA1 TaxID=1776268 RepID=A0A0U3SW94_9BACT|nr:dolichyl-phosphate-mannose-protein mannosyltransferase [uncultured bacterium pA1]
MRKKIDQAYLWLGAIVALGVALRLINIGAEPYWGDEVLSLDIVRHFPSIPEMLRYLSQVEFHPPLYYLMLHFWMPLFGEAEAGTRSLSVLFGAGTIVVAYVAGMRIFSDRKAALVAAFVTAILPMQIEYGQEARPYVIFCFFGAVAATSLWEYLRRRKRVWLAVYVVSSIIGLYLHYSYFFVLAATAGWWGIEVLMAKKGTRTREAAIWSAAHGLVFLGFYPWLTALLYKLTLTNTVIFGLQHFVVNYRGPEVFEHVIDQIVWLTKAKYIEQVEIAAKALFKVLFVWAAAVALRPRPSLFGGGDKDKWGVRYVAWLFVVPIVLFVCSPQSLPYSTLYERHAIFATVPFALFFGLVASRMKTKHAAALMAIFIATQLPFISAVAENDALWDQDHRLQDAGDYINEHYRRGDLVIVSVSIVRTDLNHYLRPDIPVAEMLPIDYYGKDMWASRETLGLIENESQVRITRPSESEIHEKLDRLDSIYHPKRIWLYGFADKDYTVHHWFSDGGRWRHAFSAIGNIFVVDLYARK